MDCTRNGLEAPWDHQDLPEDVVECSSIHYGFTPINLPSAQATRTLTDGANPKNESKKRSIGKLATTPTTVKRVRKSSKLRQTPSLQLPTATERCNSIALAERDAAIHENASPEQLAVNQLPAANTGVKISANTMKKLSSWMYNPHCETEISRGSSTFQTAGQCEAVPDSGISQRQFVSGGIYDEVNVLPDSSVGPSDVIVRDANSRAEIDENDVHARLGDDLNNQRDVDMPDSSLTESKLKQVLVQYGSSLVSSMEFEENADMLIDEEEVPHSMPGPYAQESMFPPSSLQYPFNESSDTHEVYDADLQHSSPSPVGRASSSEVERMLGRIGTCTTMDRFKKGLSGSSPSIQPISSSRSLNGLEEDEEDLFGDVPDHDMLDLAAGVFEPENSRPKIPVPPPLSPRPIGLFFKPPTFYKPGQSFMMTKASVMAPGPSKEREEMTNTESSSPSSYKSKFSSPNRARGNITSSETLPSSAPSTTAEMPPPQIPEIAKHLVAFDSNGNALPFTRPPFPDKVQDRSPITGLSNSSLLRVCFRIGEALNAAALAERTNIDLLFELYARVTYSHREGVEQHFQFADLFHSDKPPYLNGIYIGWRGCPLGELDTGVFLTGPAGKIARCVGKIKRNGPGTKWKIIILSIWQADWEDIGYVKGIVSA